MRPVLFVLLLVLPACAPATVGQTTVRWVPGAADHLRTVTVRAETAIPDTTWRETPTGRSPVVYFTRPVEAEYRVVNYRDAGDGGRDWTLVGDGEASGWGHHQLWLARAPLAAWTALSTPSRAVAFMMDGDHNDGFATFLVDGVPVGTFDMYRRGRHTLVVAGLPLERHVLEVRMDGTKRPQSPSAHVALWGGSALVPND